MAEKPSVLVYVLGTGVGTSLLFLVSVSMVGQVGGLAAGVFFFLSAAALYFLATNKLVQRWVEFAAENDGLGASEGATDAGGSD